MKKFGLIGAGGYIAPRHMKAIKGTGNQLVAAVDMHDSVGVMDSYFPNAEFFTKFELFEEFITDEVNHGRSLDYMTICSPNYLHLPHIKFALRNGINVICEKPLVLNSSDLDVIKEYENNSGANVYSILQLRLHPEIISLKKKVAAADPDHVFDVELTYMTSRGKWYSTSWKGDQNKSGGVATNIGVHFYDMLHFVFGDLTENIIHFKNEKTAAGALGYKRARVVWFLSINAEHLPPQAVKGEKLTFRSIKVDGEEIEFSGGFEDLHTSSYKGILCREGFGIDENRVAIETVETIRSGEVRKPNEFFHPALSQMIDG